MTKIGDYISDKIKCEIGIPQGTILGPNLLNNAMIYYIWINKVIMILC